MPFRRMWPGHQQLCIDNVGMKYNNAMFTPKRRRFDVAMTSLLRHMSRWDQWWLVYWRIYASLGLNELTENASEWQGFYLRVNTGMCINSLRPSDAYMRP